MRLSNPTIVPAGPPTTILVDGRPIEAYAGETVAAALAAAGIAVTGRAHDGSGRGVFCGMGVCFDCVVTIAGAGRRRSCMSLVQPGMRIGTGPGDGAPAATVARAETPPAPSVAPVVIVGAGPAGLAAALALARRGIRPVVLDERASPGGQYFKPLASSHRVAPRRSADRQFRVGARLVDDVLAAGVPILQGATVWNARMVGPGGIEVAFVRDGASLTIVAERLILAAGAFERAWAVPGWTLPGVMTTGAAQTLARAYRVSPGKRVLVAGNGPLNLQLAAEIVAGGGTVVAVVEAARSPVFAMPSLTRMIALRPDLVWDGARHLARLRVAGVPVIHGHVVTALGGNGQVETATIARIAPDGALAPGTERRFTVDAVACGYGFLPSAELAMLLGCDHEAGARGSAAVPVRDASGRTSQPAVYVAGDCGGLRGASSAQTQGALSGEAVADDLLSCPPSRRSGALLAKRRRDHAFQKALWRLYEAALPRHLATGDTILCRCERIPFGQVTDDPEQAGGTDLAAIKRRTRCGMGLCQGRYCLSILASRTEGEPRPPPRVQPPVRPVTVHDLASPAASGSAPPLAAAVPPTPRAAVTTMRPRISSAVIVIGGGIIGTCAALELARRGEDVILLEREASIGSGASGANAGSLHVQSLAYAFDTFETPEAQIALRMLPLQRDSARLWSSFAPGHTEALEVDLTGGLCVADDEAGVRKLRRKIDLERANGIDVTFLTGDEARRMVPALSPDVLAASYCPDEGKLNALWATAAIGTAAVESGARVITNGWIESIVTTGGGFEVFTDTLRVAAPRLLVAAGASTGAVLALMGAHLPVVGVPLQMIVTERSPLVIDRLVAHVSRRLTVKQARSGNAIVGGGWRAQFDARGLARATVANLRANLAVAAATLPALATAHVIRSWTAVNAMPAGGPAIGPLPGVPGCFVAVAINGLTLGPVLGRVCADLVQDRIPDWDIGPFDLNNQRTRSQ